MITIARIEISDIEEKILSLNIFSVSDAMKKLNLDQSKVDIFLRCQTLIKDMEIRGLIERTSTFMFKAKIN